MEIKCLKYISFQALFIMLLFYSGKGIAQNKISNEETLTQILAMKNDTAKVDSLITFARKMANLDELELAIKSGMAAINIAETLSHKPSIYAAQNSLGYAYKNHGDYTNAIKYYNSALKTAVELKSNVKIARTYLSLGATSKDCGEYSDAVAYCIKAIQLCEAEKDTTGLALAYLNLGIVSRIQFKLKESLSYYVIAEKYYEQLNNKSGITTIMQNKGIVYKDLKMYDSAYYYLNKAYEIRKEKKNNDFYSVALSLANILTFMGEEAIKNGDTLNADIQFLKAENLYFECLNRDIENKNELKQSNNYHNLGYLFFTRNRFQDAKKYLLRAKDIRETLKLKTGLPEIYRVLSMVDSAMACETKITFEERLKHSQQSFYFKTLQAATTFELLNDESYKRIEEIKIKYETDKKDNEINLLNKENELKNAKVKEQQAALMISRLREEKNKKEIELLNIQRTNADLKLSGTRKELESQVLKSKAKSDQLLLAKQEQKIREKELSEEKLLRGISTGAFIMLSAVGFAAFRSYRLRKKLEKQEALLHQRKAISADLHDDVGSTLSSISIYSEAIKNKLNQNETDKVMELVNKIGDNARETITNLSDIVWSINPVNDSGKVFFGRIESFAFSLLSSRDIQLQFHQDETLNPVQFNMETRHNLFLIFKEAINNAAKYSGASLLRVDFIKKGDALFMKIKDNGKGFSHRSLQADVNKNGSYVNSGHGGNGSNTGTGGNGIRNMYLRAGQLKGQLAVESDSTGTTIELMFPLT